MPCTRGIRRPGADGHWAEQVTSPKTKKQPEDVDGLEPGMRRWLARVNAGRKAPPAVQKPA